MKKFAACLVMVVGLVFAVSAKPSVNAKNIVLLQPDKVTSVRCPDVNSVSGYIKSIFAVFEDFSFDDDASGNGMVAFAVRPGFKSKVWFDFSDGLVGYEDELEQKLLKIKPCEVQGGVFLFAVPVSVNSELSDKKVPMPGEWKEYLKNYGGNIEISEMIDAIWPPYVSDEEKNEIMALIEKFRKETDFSAKSLKKYSRIIDFAAASDVVQVSISAKWWPEEVSNSRYGDLFLLSFICGSLESQLKNGNDENAALDGMNFELMKYQQLKKKDKKVNFEFFENM